MLRRRPNTRDTLIYWLFDVRPEILAQWPKGYPFYCGKTVMRLMARINKHRSDARKYPNKAISKRLNECGEHFRVQVVEVVPCTVNWSDREKFWISTLRLLWNGAVNLTAGGQGQAGYVPSDEVRMKLSNSLKGRVFSDEHRANIGKASASRSPDVYRRIGESQKGRTASPETRQKLSVAGKGKPKSPETRARMSAAQSARPKRKPISDETRAKMSAASKGKKKSAEHAANVSAGLKGKKKTATHVANSVAAKRLRRVEQVNNATRHP